MIHSHFLLLSFRLAVAESTELSLRKEVDETKNLYIDSLDTNRRRDSENTEIQRQVIT